MLESEEGQEHHGGRRRRAGVEEGVGVGRGVRGAEPRWVMPTEAARKENRVVQHSGDKNGQYPIKTKQKLPVMGQLCSLPDLETTPLLVRLHVPLLSANS